MKLRLKSELPHSEPSVMFFFNSGEIKVQSPHLNREKCTHCGTCYLYCPVMCICDKNSFFETDLSFCKGCGICAKVCHSKAITMVRVEADE